MIGNIPGVVDSQDKSWKRLKTKSSMVQDCFAGAVLSRAHTLRSKRCLFLHLNVSKLRDSPGINVDKLKLAQKEDDMLSNLWNNKDYVTTGGNKYTYIVIRDVLYIGCLSTNVVNHYNDEAYCCSKTT